MRLQSICYFVTKLSNNFSTVAFWATSCTPPDYAFAARIILNSVSKPVDMKQNKEYKFEISF